MKNNSGNRSKKPRHRNRPRNKANINNNSDSSDKLTVEEKKKDEFLVNSTPALIDDTAASHHASESGAKLSVVDNTSAFKILQQMVKDKVSIPPNKDVKPIQVVSEPTSEDQTKSKEKDSFISSLQKKMENLENVIGNETTNLPTTLLGNLQKLLNQEPISDIETSDEEDEYVEYIYKPRQYFLVSLCNFCKCDLQSTQQVACTRCQMTFYCSADHIKLDQEHRQLCYALKQVANNYGCRIFYKCGGYTASQFRSYRMVAIRKVEAAINRTLTAWEQEVLLFPRLCCSIKCREYRFEKLKDCPDCGQMAFCKDNPEHFDTLHHLWCKPYKLFKEMVMFQEKFGRLDPSLPTKVLREFPVTCSNTKQILTKLAFDIHDQCEYAALTQISTGPLTAWYALKLCDQLKTTELTIHLIGAEIEFEVDVLHKWELFFMHITPSLKQLDVVFVGPELNSRNISFNQLEKTKCCRTCRKNNRTVRYHFNNGIYHDYIKTESFIKPNLICFFNAGLYRSTGYNTEDTWPETIKAAADMKCPVVVTSYTQYESPFDMSRFLQESNRRLNVIVPPIVNPFASEKPERNFISDEDAPLIFKNYYCFIIE